LFPQLAQDFDRSSNIAYLSLCSFPPSAPPRTKKKMKFLSALSLSLAALANATPTPSITCPSVPSVFGIPGGATKSILTAQSSTGPGTSRDDTSTGNIIPNPLHVRGGELHQPETVEDVDALVFNAAANNQLVVIDFTASW
jgi:hypothetical protein